MATFWERAAHSVYRMCSLCFDIVILVFPHFGFEGGTLALILVIAYLLLIIIYIANQLVGFMSLACVLLNISVS